MQISKRIKTFLKKTRKPYAFGKRSQIDLSLSENPLGCSSRISMVLKQSIKKAPEYPDPEFKKLKQAISKCFKIPISEIAICNGSEALIDLIPKTILNNQDEAIIPRTTFPLFEKGVILADGKPVFAKMKDDFSISLANMRRKITKKTKLIILCNPNNPTGKILGRKEILNFVEEVAPVMVLVDEANIDFGGKSVIEEVNRFKNLIVLRSFSKGFGLAGLRVGFCVGPEKFIKILERVRQPFPCTFLSEPAIIASLQDKKFIEKSKNFIRNQRIFLTKELRKRGFKVISSRSNNLLVQINNPVISGRKFFNILNQKGASVVTGNNFQGLNENFFRISPRLPKINKKFIEIIDQILKIR